MRQGVDVIRVFYRLMYFAYDKMYGQQHILHYPLYRRDEQSLMEGQIYFTEHCLNRLPSLEGKQLLDVGCVPTTKPRCLATSMRLINLVRVRLSSRPK